MCTTSRAQRAQQQLAANCDGFASFPSATFVFFFFGRLTLGVSHFRCPMAGETSSSSSSSSMHLVENEPSEREKIQCREKTGN